MADLYSKCSQLAAQSEKEIGRIVNTMLPVLAYLNEPVVLKTESLGEAFRDFSSVSLQPGAIVVTKDKRGKVLSRPLAKFSTEECLAILHDSFPELQRLVADKRRAVQLKPTLSLKISVGGSHFILDMRSYRLIVSNAGGDCKELSVTSRYPGGPSPPTHPQDVGRGEEVEVDLGIFKELIGQEVLDIEFECKDADGRPMRGEQSVRLDGAGWEEARVASKQPTR
jgi:hypothetical protein